MNDHPAVNTKRWYVPKGPIAHDKTFKGLQILHRHQHEPVTRTRKLLKNIEVGPFNSCIEATDAFHEELLTRGFNAAIGPSTHHHVDPKSGQTCYFASGMPLLIGRDLFDLATPVHMGPGDQMLDDDELAQAIQHIERIRQQEVRTAKLSALKWRAIKGLTLTLSAIASLLAVFPEYRPILTGSTGSLIYTVSATLALVYAITTPQWTEKFAASEAARNTQGAYSP